MALPQDDQNVFRSLWHVLHSESFHIQYSEDDDADRILRRRGFVAFLHSLTAVMRCDKCRTHLKSYLSSHPINADTNLAKYVVDLHNEVNRRQQKRIVPFEVASQYYLEGNTLALCPANGRCSLPRMEPIQVGMICVSVFLIIAVILVCGYMQKQK